MSIIVLRVAGRLQNSEIPYDTKFPIVLTNSDLEKLILSQIEAVLNSRALYTIRDNYEDDSVLTPWRFVIGRS